VPRGVLTLLGAAAVAAVLSSIAAWAETPAIIGMMTMAAPTSIRQPVASFRNGVNTPPLVWLELNVQTLLH
jgi:hypothetical protein